jgi:hypothetical protein
MAERCLVGIHKKQVGGDVGCSWSFLCVPNIERLKIYAGPLHEMLEDRIQDGQVAKVMKVGHM